MTIGTIPLLLPSFLLAGLKPIIGRDSGVLASYGLERVVTGTRVEGMVQGNPSQTAGGIRPSHSKNANDSRWESLSARNLQQISGAHATKSNVVGSGLNITRLGLRSQSDRETPLVVEQVDRNWPVPTAMPQADPTARQAVDAIKLASGLPASRLLKANEASSLTPA